MPTKTPKRPYATLYYTDARGGLPAAQGACNAAAIKGNPIRNAKRAAATMIYAEQRYRRVEIVDTSTGLLVTALTRTTDGKLGFPDVAGHVAVNWQWRQKLADKMAAKKAARKAKK